MRITKLVAMFAGAAALVTTLVIPGPAVAAGTGSGSAHPDLAGARHSGVIRLVSNDAKTGAGLNGNAVDVIECLWEIAPPFATANNTIQTYVQVGCDNIVDRIDITVVMYENYAVRTVLGAGQDAVSGFLLPSTPVPCNNGSGYFGWAYVSVENDGFFVDDSGYSVLNVFFC